MLENELYCQGCGIKVQTKDKNKIGYVPKTSLSNPELLCQRCFRLKHYNEHHPVSLTDHDFLKMVSTIGDSKGLIVHLIDIFDVDGTLIKSLPRITGDNPVILVGNKVDLLPKSTNKHRLSQWLRSIAKEAGLRVVDVFLISSKKGSGIEDLAVQMEYYRKGKDIYVVGVTNVGKSTFINRFIKQSTGMKDVITTSYFPGTTLGFIKIPLEQHAALIDTPGIVNENQMAHYVSKKDLKMITPKKEVKSRTYQLNDQQTLFIGGLARLDFIKGDKQSFVCYFANDIPIHRTKLHKADELYEKQVGKLLSPPNEDTLSILPELTVSTYRIGSGNTDVVFSGLGWITILNGDVTIAAHSPKGVAVSLRNSFI